MKYIQRFRPFLSLVIWNIIGISLVIAFERWLLNPSKRPFNAKIQVPFYAVCIFYYWFACYIYFPFIIKKYQDLIVRLILILGLFVVYTLCYALFNTVLLSVLIRRWVFIVRVDDLRASANRCAVIFVISFLVWLVLYFFVHKRKARDLERQKHAAEKQLLELQNAFLRVQIKSHLFFNSLISLYPKVLNQAPDAPEVVLLLTDLLDYALENGEENGFVELHKDIDVLDKSIQLNRLLADRKCELIFSFQLDDENVLIAPLLMQDFVDNIFKHGDLSDPELPSIIKIKYSNHKLHFNSKNKILPPKGLPSKGIGLNNVKERLDKLYPGKHRLYTNSGYNEFEVDLIIFL
jgi:sensor histidine kinase YesM